MRITNNASWQSIVENVKLQINYMYVPMGSEDQYQKPIIGNISVEPSKFYHISKSMNKFNENLPPNLNIKQKSP